MSRRTAVLALAGLLALAHAPSTLAGSAEDVGPRIVVPLINYTKGQETRVFIHNHEVTTTEVQVRYVGEVSSSTPGMQICKPGGTNLMLAPNSVLQLDVRDTTKSGCTLLGPPDQGMLVLVAKPRTNLGRISARARIDIQDPAKPARRQTLFVDGIPLGQLDTTGEVHVSSGLAWDAAGGTLAAAPLTSDCFFGTFFDGSGAGGVLTAIRLKDSLGTQLGHDVLFALKPFQYQRFIDVFTLAGVPAGVYDNVRAEFGMAGGGDEVLAVCRTSLAATTGRAFSNQLGRVPEPQEESRRRRISVSSTPGASRTPFTIMVSDTKVLHGLYVRHPDVVKCSVGSKDALVITAVAPDKATSFTNNTMQTPEFGLLGQSYQGPSDLWGIEVSWGAGAAKTGPVTYTISCSSGNGTSLADILVE